MNEEILALIEMLKEEDERQYRFVFDRIKQIGEPAIESVLLVFLTADSHLRLNLVFLMSELRDKAFLPILIEALNDKNQRLRTSAAYALGLMADKEACPALLLALKDENPELRRNAAWGLGEIKEPSTVDALIAALDDKSVHVQEEVIFALGALQDKRAIEPLKSLIRHQVTRIVDYAFQSLLLFGADILEFLIELLEDGRENIETQRHAIWCMGKLRDPRAIDCLVKSLERQEPKLSSVAIEALGRMDDLRVLPILIPLLTRGDYAMKISESLIRIGSPALDILMDEALQNPEPEIRRSMAYILGEIKDKRALKTLLDLLRDEQSRVTYSAVAALGELGDKKAVKSLLALISHENRAMREEAANSLGKLQDKRALDALLIALMDREAPVRVSAARALGRLAERKAVPLLVNALRDSDYNVKLNALIALGQIGDTWAVRAIAPFLKDNAELARNKLAEVAAEALRKIGSAEALDALKAVEKVD